jgi:hypothetical protein
MKVLLYIGPGWDAEPLTWQQLREDHDIFLYVDAMPTLKHFPGNPDSVTDESIMKALTRDGGYRAFAGPPEKQKTHWSVALLDAAVLMYYFDVLDENMGHHTEITTLLPHVTTLFVRGFAPCDSAYELLPNLERAYSTPLCTSAMPLPTWSKTEVVEIADVDFEDGEFVHVGGWSDDSSSIDSDGNPFVTD